MRRPSGVCGAVGVLVAAGVLLAASAPAAVAQTLTVNKSIPQGGTVTSDPAGISCGADCTEAYPVEEECTDPPHPICVTVPHPVTLTGTGSNGFAVSGWSGCDSTAGASCEVVLLRTSRTVTANYADVRDPNVSMTLPSVGPKRGTIELVASAADNWGVQRVDFFVGGTFRGSDVAPPYSVQLNTATLGDGPHWLMARAVDLAGRTGVSEPRPITVDNTAPVIAITGGPGQGAALPAGTAGTFTFAASDPTSGLAEVVCSLTPAGAAQSFGPCTGPASHAFSALATGEYAFTLRATDAVGNTAVLARSFSIAAAEHGDSKAPAPDATRPTVGGLTLRVKARQRKAKLVFSGSDDVTAPADLAFTCSLDSQPAKTCSSPVTYKRLKGGRHQVAVSATDAAGNASVPATKRFRVR